MDSQGNETETVTVGVKRDGISYVIVYRNSTAGRHRAIRQAGKLASDKRIAFTWWDAAVVSQQIRVSA